MKKKIQKPFDLEEAKKGAVVETKEGAPVRILCYDREGTDYPIIALVNFEGVEWCSSYTFEGEKFGDEFDVPNDKDALVIIEEVEVSKFNVGDWVFMNTHGSQPWLVIKITPNYYEIEDSFGHTTAKSHHTIDSLFHPWTLKDAKPGDILVSTDGNRPFILRGLYYDSTPTAYCGIDTMGFITIGSGAPWTHKPIRPATYGERLQLLNKLKEKGYKWDAGTLTLWKRYN